MDEYKDYAKKGLHQKLPDIQYFENQFRKYKIKIIISEFTSICPKTSQPDFGTIIIEYEPDKYVIELKSLKLYIQAYRNLGIFYENAVNRVLKDIVEKINPIWIKVTGDFNPRGGIKSVVEVSYSSENNLIK